MRIETDFPGGGAEAIEVVDDLVRFAAPSKGCPQPMWFRFRIHGQPGVRVTCELTNARACLGRDTMAAARPVYRAGDGPWTRVADADCGYHEGRLSFAVTLPGPCVDVAYCYPYQLADLHAWLDRHAENPALTRRVLGPSPHGRPVEGFVLADPAARPSRTVWCTARQHAGEVSGSYVLEGLADGLLQRPALLADTRFAFAPMVDVDAVEEGSYGKDQRPVDFNRDWRHAPHHPAVRYLLETMATDHAEAPLALFLDLHAPHPSGLSFLVPTRASLAEPRLWNELWRLGDLFEAESPAPFRRADYSPESLDWELVLSDSISSDAVARRFQTVAVGVELAYHRDADGELMTPERWRGMGSALARAVERWFAGETVADPPPVPVPVLPTWRIGSVPRGAGVSETDGALVLEPTTSPNRVVAESPLLPVAGPAVTPRLGGVIPQAVRVWLRFRDEHGLRVGEPRPWTVGDGMPVPVPPEAVGYTMLLEAVDLPAAARVTTGATEAER